MKNTDAWDPEISGSIVKNARINGRQSVERSDRFKLPPFESSIKIYFQNHFPIHHPGNAGRMYKKIIS